MLKIKKGGVKMDKKDIEDVRQDLNEISLIRLELYNVIRHIEKVELKKSQELDKLLNSDYIV